MTTILKLQNVSKSFGALTVLNDLSFDLEQNEILGILGPNGAGKTTMLNLISGDHPVSKGQILLHGKDITKTSVAQRCHLGIGRTAQIPRPFSGMTVFENVLVGATYGGGAKESDTNDLCRAVLHQTGLYEQRDSLAGGLRLLDRRRLELARALASQPDLLLLDEIAGGLTEAEVPQLLEMLTAVRDQGISIIWIEHIVHALASTVDRILVINFGTKLIEGPPKTVLNDSQFQEIYLGIGAN